MEKKSAKPIALIIWMVISQGVGIVVGIFPVLFLLSVGGGELRSNLFNSLTFSCNPLLVVALGVASWVFASKKQYKNAAITTSSIVVWIIFYIFYFISSQIN